MRVPLYLRHKKVKKGNKGTSLPVSFLDIVPTVLEMITNVIQDDYPGCNLMPVIFNYDDNDNTDTDDKTDFKLPLLYRLNQVGLVDEQLHNKQRCNPHNRLHLHYADICKPIADT